MSNQDQDMSQYLGIYLDEGTEQLSLLESEILRMERGDNSSEVMQVMFRAAHTLKGSSRAMGFMEVGNLTHELENVLDDLRNDKLSLTQPITDALLDSVDALKGLMEAISSRGSDSGCEHLNINELVSRLNTLRTQGAEASSEDAPALYVVDNGPTAAPEIHCSEFQLHALAEAEAHGLTAHHITVRVADDCVMKSVRAFMTIAALEPLGEIIAGFPSESDLEADNFDGIFQLVFVSDKGSAAIEEAVNTVSELSSIDVAPFGKAPEKPAKKPAAKTAKKAAEAVAPAAVVESAPPAPKANTPAPASNGGDTNAGGQTIRVGLNRLDALLNLVGELVIDRTQAIRLVSELHAAHAEDPRISQLGEAMSRVSRITSELQEEVMKTRMLPIDGVFQRLPRMVRDLAQKTGKEIEFKMSGGETELDRSVLEVLGDPLIHMLRNSLDHGVESPEERATLGKPAKGTVSIAARYEENRIVIEVEDDGRGIDPAHMREVAVNKGIMSAGAAAALSDKDALALIMASGFSTAKTVSDISGRGVGMDIVRSNIERIGGRVHLDSKPGIGTKFSVHLPLTLAIVRALLVSVNKQTFVIPLSAVVEILNLSGNDGDFNRTTIAGQAAIVLRGQTIALATLWDVLSGDPIATSEKRIDAKSDVVVVSNGDRRVGICVDSVLGEQEVVIKSLGSLLGEIPGVSGASILGDGSVALIVDITSAIDELKLMGSTASETKEKEFVAA